RYFSLFRAIPRARFTVFVYFSPSENEVVSPFDSDFTPKPCLVFPKSMHTYRKKAVYFVKEANCLFFWT
ncbi:MAG: hypothetical protein ACRCS7_13760, partial [Tannerellaceae bacterium]